MLYSDIYKFGSSVKFVEKTGYGALYNWYAVDESTANGGFINGFTVPTDAQFTALTDLLGGEVVAGGKLRSTRTDPDLQPRWDDPNVATDEVNFSALPGGFRHTNGTYNSIGGSGFWWSSTEDSATNAWRRYLRYFSGDVLRYHYSKGLGYSVRCVRPLDINEQALDDGTYLNSVKDYYGNTYQVVKIGDLAWTAQDLRTTHYADGTPIPNVTDNAAWGELTTGAYAWYDNDIETAGIVYSDEQIILQKAKLKARRYYL